MRDEGNVKGSGIAHVGRAAIGEFLGKLKYPLYYLDFESFNPAIPPGLHGNRIVALRSSAKLRLDEALLERRYEGFRRAV